MAAGNGSGKVTVGRKQVGFVILCVVIFSIVVIRNMMDSTTRLSSIMNGAIKELVTAPPAKTSDGHGAVTEMVTPPTKASDGHKQRMILMWTNYFDTKWP